MSGIVRSRALRLAGRVLAALLAIVLLVCSWGVIEPRLILDERRETVALPDLPPGWDGGVVAAIGDLQVGMWLPNISMIERTVARIVALRPNLVILLGDYLYETEIDPEPDDVREAETREEVRERAAEIALTLRLLQPLIAAGLPVVAVLGNHDYGMMVPEARPRPEVAREVATAFDRAGITVLRNGAVPIRRGGAPLFVAGLDAHYPARDDATQALQALPDGAARLVIMHNPQSFWTLPAGSAPLAVAGHTHGGQIRIPGFPAWSWMKLARKGEVHADGWVRPPELHGNQLYINRGIGFSLVPLRVNCPPELTVFTLQRTN